MGTHLKFLPFGTMGTRLNFLPLGTQFNLVYSITGGSMTAGTTVLRKNENALEIGISSDSDDNIDEKDIVQSDPEIDEDSDEETLMIK